MRRCTRLRPRAERGLARYCGVNPVLDRTDQISLFAAPIGRTDHGKEVEGEEEIREEKGGAGPQKEENSKIRGQENRKEGSEKSREKGCSEAQGTGEEASDARASPGS
jgi:hypothetical protein